MLPDDVFKPLDLDVVLDEARDSGDGEGAIALLERALGEPRTSDDGAARDYLDALVEASNVAGRQGDAIEALGRIAERQPGLRGATTDVTAGLYARLGESDAAMTLVRQRYAEQQALPAAQRDIDFYAAGAVTAGELVGDMDLAGRLISEGQDFGDDWTHTVTLEEIREAGPENIPELLDGAGACPPEDCGGPVRYLALVQALRDSAHPDHDEAVEWLGEDHDPASYRPHVPVGGVV
jgi:Plasmid pRiA4b ORF-3-like protein